ncbi:ParB N-terminal domain-containing protein [Dysgonomonas macrotermitis]|uniref:DNA methylase n=1 Tax=Dysgonomonas macrotermitis TaxID=1346286 RepID=A0A1M5C408_9BACT|nr:hypothetical protein [Dysgonomonas macrotermitis]SHF49425.1 hypothetical protein SAMN05444362_10721 [Dysgonomonas macrotermitis]
MSKLKFDPKNYRIHGEKNKRLIRKSLEDCGAGRSILFDNENCIIAGNGVYEQAQELGLKVRVIESDGTELIAIKRTDLKTEDSRRKALALADNYTNDTSVFDIEAVMEDFTPEDLDLWEFSIDLSSVGIGATESSDKKETGDDLYTNKITTPQYLPKNEKPAITDLFDLDKYNELVSNVEDSNLSSEDKKFLICAAARHIVFNYEKIADYYAHSDKDVQELMEDSALVIIDFDSAISKGFVKLTQDIDEQYDIDHEE